MVRPYLIAAGLWVAAVILGGVVWSPFGARSGGVFGLLAGTAAIVLGRGVLTHRQELERIYSQFRLRFVREHARSIVAIVGRAAIIAGILGGIDVLVVGQVRRRRPSSPDSGELGLGRSYRPRLSRAREAGLEATGHGVLKTAPKGYPKDHPRIELLRYKGLITWREWPAGAWLGTRRTKDRVVEFLRLSRGLNEWLRTRVGPSIPSSSTTGNRR